jgi:hypothetical protein
VSPKKLQTRRVQAQLRDLVMLKTTSHYGFGLLTPIQRKLALRCATALVANARLRQP